MATAIAELRNTSLYEILLEKGTVKFRSHTFEGDAQKVVFRLQKSLRDGIALGMSDTFNLLDDRHQTVVGSDKVRIRIVESEYVVDLYMSTETDHLIADGVLETKHHTYGDNHHSQTDCYTDGGNTDSRTTDFPFVALITIDLLGYE